MVSYSLLRWDEATFCRNLQNIPVSYAECRGRLEAGSGIGRDCIQAFAPQGAFTTTQIEIALGTLKDSGRLATIIADASAALDAVAAIARVVSYSLLRWHEATLVRNLTGVVVDYASCRGRLEAGSGLGEECIPDVFLIYRGRAYFIEMKEPAAGQLSDPQKCVLAALIAAAAQVGVATCAEDVLVLIDAWQIPRKGRVVFAS